MKEEGFVLRLDLPSDTNEINEGDTVKLYCEGKGLRKDNVIAFKDCHGRLEED
jgi:hypothetical protein